MAALREHEKKLKVSSLICHGHVEMAIRCLGSLATYSLEPIELVLHDDGSLTTGDVAELKASLPVSRVVAPDEAEAEMRQRLRKHPRLWELRSRQVLAKKALDCVLFTEGSRFRYCDTDILFFRPFQGLFDATSLGADAVLMRDESIGYSINARFAIHVHGLRLPSRGNSGLLCYDTSYFDLDEMESFASSPALLGWPPLWEQTLFALVGGRHQCRIYDPSQIACIAPRTSPDDGLIAGHFYSPMRWRLQEFSEPQPATRQQPHERVRTYKPSPLTPLSFLVDKAALKFRRPDRSH